MLHAWDNYKLYTWGENELATITKSKVTNGIFGVQKLGLTIVDSIDTLYIMGLKDEFEDAKDWIAEKFSFKNIVSTLFEFTLCRIKKTFSIFRVANFQCLRRTFVL